MIRLCSSLEENAAANDFQFHLTFQKDEVILFIVCERFGRCKTYGNENWINSSLKIFRFYFSFLELSSLKFCMKMKERSEL